MKREHVCLLPPGEVLRVAVIVMNESQEASFLAWRSEHSRDSLPFPSDVCCHRLAQETILSAQRVESLCCFPHWEDFGGDRL